MGRSKSQTTNSTPTLPATAALCEHQGLRCAQGRAGSPRAVNVLPTVLIRVASRPERGATGGVVLFLVSLSIWTVRRTSVGVLKMMAMTTAQITSERTSASFYILSVLPRIREFAITVRRPTPSEHQFLAPRLTSDSPLSTSEAPLAGPVSAQPRSEYFTRLADPGSVNQLFRLDTGR